MRFYVYDDAEKKPMGPFEPELLWRLEGFNPETKVCPEGAKAWVPAKSLPEFSGVLAAPRPRSIPVGSAGSAPVAGQARRLGALLSDAFSLAASRPPTFIGIVLLALAAKILLVHAGSLISGIPIGKQALTQALKAGRYAAAAALIACGMLGALADSIGYAALILALAERARGQAANLRQALGLAQAVIVPLLLVDLQVLGWIILGALLLLVPGILWAIRYMLAHLAVLLEGRHGADALSRSKEIMIAHVGKVIGNTAVAGLAGFIVVVLGKIVLAVPLALFLRALPAPAMAWALTPAVFVLALPGALVKIWTAAVFVLLYLDLASLHPAQAPAAG
ncbi:MAG TPA: hypothetical protein VNK24_10980 [Elusimicrobiota bacterium]|nr:hypothetical protein [Elusimicrobiota bacterium]